MLPDLLKAVTEKFKITGDLRSEPVHPASVFDSSQVSDHHAIIPTKTMAESDLTSLPTDGDGHSPTNIRKTSAQPEKIINTPKICNTQLRAEEFTRKGRTVLQLGWKGICQQFYLEKKNEEDVIGQVPGKGTRLTIDSAKVKEGKTSPPKHFTEDTLLSAMVTAGEDEIPEEAERKGLGTPATRAATIEKLVQRGFMERKGDCKTKHLIATDKGNSLKPLCRADQPASMTAEWERNLAIEHGEYDAADFMNGIRHDRRPGGQL